MSWGAVSSRTAWVFLAAVRWRSRPKNVGDLREGLAAWLCELGAENPDRDAKLLAATIGEAVTEGVDRDMLFGA